MGGGADGASHETDSDGNPNVFKLERNDDGLWLNNNWAKPDNEWNPDNKFVFRFRNCFLSAALQVAVFLFRVIKIFLPTTEHLADFLELYGDILAVLVGNDFSFPRYGNKKFKGIHDQDTFRDFLSFSFLFGKISNVG